MSSIPPTPKYIPNDFRPEDVPSFITDSTGIPLSETYQLLHNIINILEIINILPSAVC